MPEAEFWGLDDHALEMTLGKAMWLEQRHVEHHRAATRAGVLDALSRYFGG